MPVDSHEIEAALGALEQICGGDAEALHYLVQVWVDATIERMADLQRAAETADLVLIERTAHTIKGSGATFGAIQVGEAARSLESCARAADGVEATSDAIVALEQSVEETLEVVRRVLEQRGIG